MPGARIARMVARKLTAAAMLPTPLSSNPSAQNSTAGPRLNVCSVSGAWPNQPTLGKPPVRTLAYTSRPPNSVVQNPMAFRREGHVHAAIWSGTR